MSSDTPLGILSGSGDFPWLVIDHCRETDRDFVVVSFEGQSYDREFSGMKHGCFPLGAVGKIVDFLKSSEVGEIVLAGGIKRPNLRNLNADKLGMKIIAKYLSKGMGDDGLLTATSELLESLVGAKVIGYEDLFGLIKRELGSLGSHVPSHADIEDMGRAEEVFRCFSACDVGQSLVLQSGIVIAVEAIEGTEGLLQRCSSYLREGGRGFLYKKMKPNQFRNADLPTIGEDTVRQVKDCGLQGLVIGQSGVIILNYASVIDLANEFGLFIHVVE